jgi:hypothetical protein
LISNASALHIDAQGMGMGVSERDEFGNWASAWAKTSSGSFDFEPTVIKSTDGYGNPYIGANCAGNAWTTDGYAEVGTSAGNGYDSANSVVTVNGIGSINTDEYAVSGYGVMYSSQSTGATLGDYGSANAYSQFSGSSGNANTNAYIDGSGTLNGNMRAGYDGSFLGAWLNAGLANNGYGTTSISTSYGDYYMGAASVNAYATNGAINTDMTAQRIPEGVSTSGNIRNIEGEYGRIDLNSYAYNTGVNSNKNAEFWNGYANSGVTAGTDGYNAWTAWEAPVV